MHPGTIYIFLSPFWTSEILICRIPCDLALGILQPGAVRSPLCHTAEITAPVPEACVRLAKTGEGGIKNKSNKQEIRGEGRQLRWTENSHLARRRAEDRGHTMV